MVREDPAAWPVPLAWINARGVEALPITDRVAEALPAACGVKLEVHEALCPASRVKGIAGPVTLKAVPETETPDIMMGALPVFLSTRLCRLEEPTVTWPKTRLAGVGVRERPEPATPTHPDSAIIVHIASAKLN
jgi:hypothetical protein